jgi:hypothetical protein
VRETATLVLALVLKHIQPLTKGFNISIKTLGKAQTNRLHLTVEKGTIRSCKGGGRKLFVKLVHGTKNLDLVSDRFSSQRGTQFICVGPIGMELAVSV